nr:ww domain binding protein 4 [Hymenolepis microstoma]
MADYWKSNPKKYCDICKCWIQDNAISVKNHEGGQRHITNVQKKLNELQKSAKSKSGDKLKEKISLINDMAFVGMIKDLEQDPSLAQRYGVNIADLKAASKKENPSASDNKKKDAKTKMPDSVLTHPAVSKTIVYEWKELKTEDGRIYYWNKKTNNTQWERPQASIEPINDSLCVSREKNRLNQFLFHRLVDLSESGNAVASEAVCQAFGAKEPDMEMTPITSVEEIPLPPEQQPPTAQEECIAIDIGPSEEKMPRINLLGDWRPVTPPKPQEEQETAQEGQEKEEDEKPTGKLFMKPDNLIRQRITTLANKNLKHDQARLEEISRKADILSHLSEVNEAGIRSDRKINFQEKQAAISAAALKETRKIQLLYKQDPDVKNETPGPTISAISFKRKAGGNRSLRKRDDD